MTTQTKNITCKECLRINKGYEEFVYCADCELKRINENGVIITK